MRPAKDFGSASNPYFLLELESGDARDLLGQQCLMRTCGLRADPCLVTPRASLLLRRRIASNSTLVVGPGQQLLASFNHKITATPLQIRAPEIVRYARLLHRRFPSLDFKEIRQMIFEEYPIHRDKLDAILTQDVVDRIFFSLTDAQFLEVLTVLKQKRADFDDLSEAILPPDAQLSFNPPTQSVAKLLRHHLDEKGGLRLEPFLCLLLEHLNENIETISFADYQSILLNAIKYYLPYSFYEQKVTPAFLRKFYINILRNGVLVDENDYVDGAAHEPSRVFFKKLAVFDIRDLKQRVEAVGRLKQLLAPPELDLYFREFYDSEAEYADFFSRHAHRTFKLVRNDWVDKFLAANPWIDADYVSDFRDFRPLSQVKPLYLLRLSPPEAPGANPPSLRG